VRGIHITKAKVISSDERRDIISITNGVINIQDIHVCIMKKGDQILGNHHHSYSEVCYCFKGSCYYWLHNTLTGEKMEVEFKEGDVMYRAPYVTHTCKCSEDCILIDGAEKSWLSEDWNHTREELQ